MGNTWISNKAIVLRLIQKATNDQSAEIKGVLGKKALQKSIYFFSLKNNFFHYKWADYGPFCIEVQQIVLDLMHGQNIKIRDIETGKPEAVIKNMLYVEGSYDFAQFQPDLDAELEEIAKFTMGKNPRELELLASVHFWAVREQELKSKYTSNYIYAQLNGLKPDAHFTESDVIGAIATLEENHFLTPNTK